MPGCNPPVPGNDEISPAVSLAPHQDRPETDFGGHLNQEGNDRYTAGTNELVLRVRGGAYASGGFSRPSLIDNRNSVMASHRSNDERDWAMEGSHSCEVIGDLGANRDRGLRAARYAFCGCHVESG